MTAATDARRLQRLVPDLIDVFGLDLTGMNVLTEAASGPYLAAPVIAAAAGAARVLALAADSRFHRADEVERDTVALARAMGVEVEVVRAKEPELVAEADIVTNSGSLRPIDAQMVRSLKPTAVVCLMWETWEFLPEQLDLEACRSRGILVLGTNEREPPCDLRPYAGLTAVKLLLMLGLEIRATRVLLLGRQPSLGRPMEELLTLLGADVVSFGQPGEGARAYDELPRYVAEHPVDAVLAADHVETRPLIAPGGLLDPELLARHNRAARIGVISGLVDHVAIEMAGLTAMPERGSRARGHAYSISELGPRPVLELYSAGLLVGQVAARARLAGLDVQASRRIALRDAPAMGFWDDPL